MTHDLKRRPRRGTLALLGDVEIGVFALICPIPLPLPSSFAAACVYMFLVDEATLSAIALALAAGYVAGALLQMVIAVAVSRLLP